MADEIEGIQENINDERWQFVRSEITGGENDGMFRLTLAEDNGEGTITGVSLILSWEDLQRLSDVCTR